MNKKFDENIPCNQCGYCPYGALVEGMQISKEETYNNCPVFGHDCPYFKYAHGLDKEMWKRIDEKIK